MSIKNTLKKILKNLKGIIISILIKIKQSFIKATKGEENFYLMLWGWGIFPAFFTIFYLEDRINKMPFNLISVLLYAVVISFFIWHIFAIRITLKKYPEYKEKKEKDDEKYKGLNKKQIRELKQKERKKQNRDVIKKALLLKPWDSAPLYKIVIVLDCIVILTQVNNILYILR